MTINLIAEAKSLLMEGVQRPGLFGPVDLKKALPVFPYLVAT